MSAPLGRREFFALEAGEYLERLSALAGGSARPDGEEFVRYARALRGAALMAGPPGYSTAAAAVESIARRVRDGTLGWTPVLAERLADALEDCKTLLRSVRDWGDPELSRCDRIARTLDRLTGGETRPSPVPQGPGTAQITPGVRAFVARESAAVAGALDRAADEIERYPSPSSGVPVLQRLQTLRGLGALPGLSPLPELLETLDLALAVSGRGGAWPPEAGRALRAAGTALARMARDIAELGIPQGDSYEVVAAAERLREALRGDDVLPIASLFAAGDPDPIVARGSPPLPPAPPVDPAVELVSLADRLRMGAGQMTEASGSAGRTLHLLVLALTLRGLPMTARLRAGSRDFLDRLDREIMAGRAGRDPIRLAVMLGRAADALGQAANGDPVELLSGALAPLAAELDRMGGAGEPAVRVEAPPPAPREEAAAPPPAPVAEAPPVVPIEELAPEEPAPAPAALEASREADIIPIEALLAETGAVPGDLTPFEQSFSTYFRLLHGAASEPLALEAVPEAADADIVPIEGLLYHGRRALERADAVREELDRVLRTRPDLSGVEPLLAELMDLVPLALADDR